LRVRCSLHANRVEGRLNESRNSDKLAALRTREKKGILGETNQSGRNHRVRVRLSMAVRHTRPTAIQRSLGDVVDCDPECWRCRTGRGCASRRGDAQPPSINQTACAILAIFTLLPRGMPISGACERRLNLPGGSGGAMRARLRRTSDASNMATGRRRRNDHSRLRAPLQKDANPAALEFGKAGRAGLARRMPVNVPITLRPLTRLDGTPRDRGSGSGLSDEIRENHRPDLRTLRTERDCQRGLSGKRGG